MKKALLFIVLFINSGNLIAQSTELDIPLNLISPPATKTENSIVLFWSKPQNHQSISQYIVYQDGIEKQQVGKTNCTLNNLLPGKTYSFYIIAKSKSGSLSAPSQIIKVKTNTKNKVYNITDFGAKPNADFNNTKAIQSAINACKAGGTVLVPKGVFITGALYLKSNITLYIQNDGVLKASTKVDDYLPLVKNRFEGWELDTYASLINVGTMDKTAGFTTQNVAIRGEGTIEGGGMSLAEAMIKEHGIRCRGRLICIMNARDVNVQGLSLRNSHCWTLHYIYSKNVTCNDLKIESQIINGDGIDPDSSTDSYIFNCTFATGDDCIAIKSGKNPEGNVIGRPSKNITIADCEFTRGLSLAIGSEMSGGVSDILIRDCKIGDLKEGVQVKSRKDRGGYVQRLTVENCNLKRIKIETTIAYNSDGEPAPVLPYFKDMFFLDLNMTGGKPTSVPIMVDGFSDENHYTSNILFKNITLPKNSVVSLNYTNNIKFEQVETVEKALPEFKITNSINIVK